MTRWVMLLILATALFTSTVWGEPTKSLPILIWYGPAPSDNVREEMNTIRLAGFNQILFRGLSADANRLLLEYGHALGIDLYITDETIYQFCLDPETGFRRLDSLTQNYLRHPSFLGYLLFEKPSYGDFKSFVELVDFFSGKYAQLDYFIQGHPIYATQASLDTTQYDIYLSQFVEKLKPKFITIEYSAIENNILRPEILQNLHVLSEMSRTKRIPFWGFVLLNPVGQPPTVPHSFIRVQAYTALAYGARGIQYYAFHKSDANSEFPTAAVLNPEEQISQTFLNCALVNSELRKLEPILMNLEALGVYYSKPVPPGGSSLTPGLMINKIEAEGMLVGFFKDQDNHNYVLLVNTNCMLGKKCRVYFSSAVQEFVEVAKDDLPAQRYMPQSDKSGNTLELLFKAGDGRLFRIIN